MNSRRKQSKKRTIAKRDGLFCAYCGCELSLEETTLDHYKPKSKGGSDKNQNLKLACRECNQAKGNRYPFNIRSTKNCR